VYIVARIVLYLPLSALAIRQSLPSWPLCHGREGNGAPRGTDRSRNLYWLLYRPMQGIKNNGQVQAALGAWARQTSPLR